MRLILTLTPLLLLALVGTGYADTLTVQVDRDNGTTQITDSVPFTAAAIGALQPSTDISVTRVAASKTVTAAAGEGNDRVNANLTFTGNAPAWSTYVGSGGHFRGTFNNASGQGTIHGVSAHGSIMDQSGTQNEVTAAFFDTNSEDAGRLWGMDLNVMGPVSNQADLLMGPSFLVNNYNSGPIPNGGWGTVITTWPGAGGGDRAASRYSGINANCTATSAPYACCTGTGTGTCVDTQTYPLTAGLAIVGATGTHQTPSLTGYNTGIQLGGYAGGWMASGMVSRFGTGLRLLDIYSGDGIDMSGATIAGAGIRLAPSQSITDGTFSASLAQLSQLTKINVAELSATNTGNRATAIDLHSSDDATQTAYSARLARGAGLNGTLTIDNLGSGGVQLNPGSNAVIEVNAPETGNRISAFDLHASDSVDYSTRLIRNSGTNGDFHITQSGTGGIYLDGPVVASSTGAFTSLNATSGVTVSGGNAVVHNGASIGTTAAPVGADNATGIKLDVRDGAAVAAGSGNYKQITKIGGLAADGNRMQSNFWLMQDNSTSTWQNYSFVDGISIGASSVGTTPSTALSTYERTAQGAHKWGSAGSTFASLGSTGLSLLAGSLDVSNTWGSPGAGNIIGSFTSYGDQSRVSIRRANGTASFPTATANSDNLGNFNFRGYYTTDHSGAATTASFTSGVASITATAEEAFTSADQGTRLSFSVTPKQTATPLEAMRIHSSKNVSIGTTADNGHKLEVAGNISVSGYTFEGLDDKTASFTTGKGTSRITLDTGTATVTLLKALPGATTTSVLVTVAGAAASGVSFAAESGGSISWGDAGAPTFTNNKTADVVCTSENAAATTAAAWRCVKGGNF